MGFTLLRGHRLHLAPVTGFQVSSAMSQTTPKCSGLKHNHLFMPDGKHGLDSLRMVHPCAVWLSGGLLRDCIQL